MFGRKKQEHVCEEFTRWTRHVAKFTDAWKSWQERTCTLCGRIHQEWLIATPIELIPTGEADDDTKEADWWKQGEQPPWAEEIEEEENP